MTPEIFAVSLVVVPLSGVGQDLSLFEFYRRICFALEAATVIIECILRSPTTVKDVDIVMVGRNLGEN